MNADAPIISYLKISKRISTIFLVSFFFLGTKRSGGGGGGFHGGQECHTKSHSGAHTGGRQVGGHRGSIGGGGGGGTHTQKFYDFIKWVYSCVCERVSE